MRTRLPILASMPGATLMVIAAAVAVAGIAITLPPFGVAIGFVPLPPGVIAGLMAIVALYCGASELLKLSLWRVTAGPSGSR